MKSALKLAAAVALLATASAARATPSTTFWTPATTYTQPYLVPHLTYDTYFGEGGDLPLTTGLTIGVLPFQKVQAEIGFDLMYPGATEKGLYLNGRLTLPEGAFGASMPGLSVGIQSVGVTSTTDYNILHGTVGKTLPFVGTLAVGGYYGLNEDLLLNELGEPVDQGGFMASWVSPEIKIGKPGLDKIYLMADLMTGDHALGAVGAGVGLYFTPAIALLTGPVFFLNPDVVGQDTMWSMQIDVDVDFFSKH